MRVLVTGVSGFVGGRLARRLVERGDCELWGLSRREPAGLGDRLVWRPVDVTDRRAVIAFVREAAPQRVFHLAAAAHPGDCRSDPERALATQVTGTAALLAALPAAARALVVSSSEVYGGETPSPIPESAPLRAASPYGRSKRAEEAVAAALAGRGRSVVVARPFNHSGPGQSERYVLPALARRIVDARETGKSIAAGNLYPRRDFLHVDDVLDAYELLIEEGRAGEAYNVARGESTSIGDLLAVLQELAGTRLEVVSDPARRRAGDPEQITGDSRRLRALGWAPRISVRELLSEVLESARS